jgi:uncharacterized membrane protein YphA (DoxX/SURF4 family)
MNQLLRHPAFVWACRWLLAGVFLYAAWSKITDIPAFATAIGHYDMIPTALLPAFATLLAGLEVVVGLSLLTGIWRRGSSLMAALMLTLFIVAIGTAWVRGLSIDCGCFTNDLSLEKAEALRRHMLQRLAEDGGLLLAALVAFRAAHTDEGAAT